MRVSLDNLRTDMVLAADIVDSGGRLLLPNGTVLTDKHLRYCQMWGVAEAEVEGTEAAAPDADAEFDPAVVAEAEAAVAARFTHADRSHPAIAALFRHCVERHLRKGH